MEKKVLGEKVKIRKEGSTKQGEDKKEGKQVISALVNTNSACLLKLLQPPAYQPSSQISH